MNHIQIEHALKRMTNKALSKELANEINGRLHSIFARLRSRAKEPAWDSVMDSVNVTLNIWLTNNAPSIREQTADRAKRFLTSVDDTQHISYWIDDIRDHVMPVMQEFYDYRRR